MVDAKARAQYPVTPDGRYFVVRGRLWRCSNPSLTAEQRGALVLSLMQARSAKGRAMRKNDRAAQEQARRAIDEAKHQLGERGAPWWTDGAPDWNRHMAKNSPYADWYGRLAGSTVAGV